MRSRLILSLLIILFLAANTNAQATVDLSSWTWQDYTGTSTWRVEVTESGCGYDAETNVRSVTIEHNRNSATMGDLGHGPITGTMEGNTLHIASRTVPDGPTGTSVLSSYDVIFSKDCSTFSATYYWDYSDEYGSCSGSTSLSGTNSKGGCPMPDVVPIIPDDNPKVITPSIETLKKEIAEARFDLDKDLELRKLRNKQMNFVLELQRRNANDDMIKLEKGWIAKETQQIDALEPGIEAKYKIILDKDPYNFWANWDMAELRKQQGKYEEFYAYFENAASNKNQFEGTKNTELEKNVAADLGLSKIPTVETSRVVRTIQDDTSNRWTGGSIYNLNVPKKAAENSFWNIMLSTTYSEKIYGFVVEIVGPPEN